MYYNIIIYIYYIKSYGFLQVPSEKINERTYIR